MKEKNWQTLLADSSKLEDLYKNKSLNRIVGRVGKNTSGKSLIIVASMYGNELAALIAMEEVFANLSHEKPVISGLFLGLIGNLMALHTGKPFIDEELNHMWDRSTIEDKKKSALFQGNNESVELMELVRIIEQVQPFDREKFLFVNLSARVDERLDYVMPNSDVLSSYYAKKLKIPIIKNISAVMQGTSIQYFDSHGLPAISLTTNRPSFIEMVTAIKSHIYQLLYRLNIIDKNFYFSQHTMLPKDLNRDYEKFSSNFEFVYRHRPKENQQFQMHSSIAPFQKVEKGTMVASDFQGPIFCKKTGYLLFNKGQHEDGFCILEQEK